MPRIHETERVGFDQTRPPMTAEQQQMINELAYIDLMAQNSPVMLRGDRRIRQTADTDFLRHEGTPRVEIYHPAGSSQEYHGEDPREMKREGPPDLWSRMDELQKEMERMKQDFRDFARRITERLSSLEYPPQRIPPGNPWTPPTQNSYPPSVNEMPLVLHPYTQPCPSRFGHHIGPCNGQPCTLPLVEL